MSKKQKIGFAADRPNFMSYKDQCKKLVEYGVHPSLIYDIGNTLEKAIESCNENTELVVYSARTIGVQSHLKAAVQALAKNKGTLVILRPKKPLVVNAVDSLPYTLAVEDINQRNVGLGKVYGRKKKILPPVADKIINFVNVQFNSQKAAALEYGTSVSTVSRIINGKYFSKTRYEEK